PDGQHYHPRHAQTQKRRSQHRRERQGAFAGRVAHTLARASLGAPARFMVAVNGTRTRALTLLFATTLFVSAALLFWVEPMVAKMLLPLLGGTPAVWNTCLLFFQATLLAGYAYALAATKRLTLKQQIIFQCALLALACISLPIALSTSTINTVPTEGNPAFWLITRLALIVGLPFFVLATNGPLLQHWFAATRHIHARDPYFLYAASNAGSLLALVAYPALLEPRFTLPRQSLLWTIGYALLCTLLLVFALIRCLPCHE